MKVLIISPAFPPLSTVGVVRMSSLASYLVKEQDDVTVICDEANSQNTNGKGVTVPGGLKIIRINTEIGERDRQSAYSSAIINECQNTKYDIAIVTLGPYFTLRFCSKVFNFVKVPYILDFRDVGVFDDILTNNPIKRFAIILRRSKSFYYEFISIRSSRYVVSVTDGWVEKKKRNYPMFSKKMVKVENGYDGERLSQYEFSRKDTVKHSIAILGKLGYYSISYAKVFIDALNELQSIYPDLSFIHISDYEKEIEDYIREKQYRINYRSTGFVDYIDGMKELNRSSIYAIIDRRKDAMGTKIYDYIYLDRPIVYIGPDETSICKTVQSFKNGFCCKDVSDCVSSIRKIFEEEIECLDDTIDKKKFSRERQNENYRNLLIESKQ